MSNLHYAFANAWERTDSECEYARRMVLKAWALYEDGKLAEAAYEVRSFPAEVAGNTELEQWAATFAA
jgi:hypothetical protein